MLITDTKATQKRSALMTAVVIVVCLFALVIFPVQTPLQILVMSVSFLVVIPILYTMLVLRQPFANFGLTKGNARAGWLWVAISLPAIAVTVLLLRKYTGLFDDYLLPQLVVDNFSVFVLYELLVVGVQAAAWEYFLRGFVIGGFRNVIGWWAVVASISLAIIVSGDNTIMIGFVLAAPFAGIVAFYSCSIYYSFIITISTVLFIDMLTIAVVR